MVPNLAYVGLHERDNINPEGITYRFIVLLGEAGFDREELSCLPNEAGMVAKPFSVNASKLLAFNDSNSDIAMEG